MKCQQRCWHFLFIKNLVEVFLITNLEVFKNEEFGEVRTVLINNEPYFVGKDVAKILGYSNPRKALIDHVDSEDKGGNEM